MIRLPYQDLIYNTLEELKLPFYFSSVVFKHIAKFIDGILSFGFTGKITEIHKASMSDNDRTTINRFLNSNSWNDEFLSRICRKMPMKVLTYSKPLFYILDDTICTKSKPLSQAKNPTEGASFHFSHTEHRNVYGHQFLQMMVKSDTVAYPYDLELYDKTQSKIELSINMIKIWKFPKVKHTFFVIVGILQSQLLKLLYQKGST
jgi:hypothetical protein